MRSAAGRITCPTLFVECQDDFAGGGARGLLPGMTAPATVLELSAEQGAGGHCGGLGQQVWQDNVYPWIDRVLTGRATIDEAATDRVAR